MEKQFTATVFVVQKINGVVRVLLHQHKKHHAWLGIGGHVEAGENPVEAAIREVKEEAGVDVTIIGADEHHIKTPYVTSINTPFTILEQRITDLPNVPEHIHIDSVYFGKIIGNQEVSMKEEFKWFSSEDLEKAGLADDILYIAKMAIEKCKNLV